MLKLEKTSDLSGLTVRLRERERFFEPRLIKALVIALLLHSGALFLFQVTPFYLSSTFTFPPIAVQSDHPSQGVSALLVPYMEEEEEAIAPPPLTLIPSLDWVSFSQESLLSPHLGFNPHIFQSLEERVWPMWQMSLFPELKEPQIHLVISGDLADYPLVSTSSLLHQMHSLSSPSSPKYVSYHVQMDEKTGELLWYERTQSSESAAVDSLTEKILLHLRFTPSKSLEMIRGTLNFVILTSEKT